MTYSPSLYLIDCGILGLQVTDMWKATKTAEILTQTFMTRIESGSTFSVTTAGAAN